MASRPRRISKRSNEELIPDNEELIPEGIINNGHGRFKTSRSFIASIESGVDHVSTFAVVPAHTELPDVAGVRFNVETVPEALESHLRKRACSRRDIIDRLTRACAFHYTEEEHTHDKGSIKDIRIEAASETEDINVVHTGSNGFVLACVESFAQHLPLELAPDHVWVLISYAFAKHVDQNAVALQKNFVQHEGKKRLSLETPPSFRMSSDNNAHPSNAFKSSGNDPDTGASAKEWETFVFPEFSSQIRDYIGDKTHSAIASDFTTTTAASKAVHEITLMSAMKNYFSYGMTTRCGIPSITLLGTEEDWVALRARAEKLGSLMLPEFSKYWMPNLLLPVLDEFVESYRGKVNHGFWQSMVKLRDTGGGSGRHSFISGWIQILFPFLASGELNKRLRPWQEMYFRGPELESFPVIASAAPVDWEYHGTVFDITFHGGVLGCSQNPMTGALSPFLGWYVSHAPPKLLVQQLKDITAELNSLLLGHKEEAEAEVVDTEKPWHRRFLYLQERKSVLEEQVTEMDSE